MIYIFISDIFHCFLGQSRATVEIYLETKHSTQVTVIPSAGLEPTHLPLGGGSGPAVGCIIGDETKQIVVARHLFYFAAVIPYIILA